MQHQSVLEYSQDLYSSSGQSGVIDYFNSIDWQSWAICSPCESKTPHTKGICLVCWTPIKEIENAAQS